MNVPYEEHCSGTPDQTVVTSLVLGLRLVVVAKLKNRDPDE